MGISESTSQDKRRRVLGRRVAAIGCAASAALIAMVLAPAGALAQATPTNAQYDPPTELISQGGSGGGGQLGSLPFTGFDVAGLIVIALGLAAAGLVLRRRTRDRGPESATR